MNFYFFIKFAVEAEAKLEEIRVLLASLDNFEPFTTYKRLDQPRTGGLQPQDIFEFLNDNDIQVTQEQLDYIFRVLDEDTDGLITYQDFKSAILPKMNDQVKDQALNHKGYDLPVDMQLPNEIETQLSQFFIQIKQNYIKYNQLKINLIVQQKIDLNQLDIYDNDNQITLDSLKNWLQQQEQDISEEILQNFIIIIQGQQKLLQNLLDQIYLENQEDQDENYEQEQQQEENENVDQEQIQEDQEQIQQQEELEQEQQNDIEADLDEKDGQQNPQQEVHSQELDHNNQNINHDLQNDIDFEIYQLKNKIYQLEIQLEIPSQQTNIYYIGQLFGKEQNRQKFSRTSYLNRFDHSLCYYGNDFMRQKIWLDEEIQREEIKQKILLQGIINILIQTKNQNTILSTVNQLKNSGKINYYSSFISDRSYNQIQHSPLNKSKYTSDYSGSKYSVSNRKPYLSSLQKSINFSNRKF